MIYFDNASTTKPDKEVLDCFNNASENNYANPHSIHKLAMDNAANIERKKNEILKLLGLSTRDYEVIFTSGATESNNIVIQGFAHRNSKRFNHLMTSNVEHNSVLNVFKELEKEGFKVDYIKVNKEGVLDLNDLKNHLDGRPVFASFMGVNNEIGTVNNLKEIREILGPDSILHSDLVQAIGKAKIDYASLDMMTFTSHKIYGLKGCGCFIKKRKINLNPIVYGGNQEDGLRSGTMDYPSICAFTFALEKVLKEYDKDYAAVKEIRDYIVSKLKDVKGVVIHDFPSCSPYILNISLTEKKASVVVEGLSNKEIYVNSVSACYSKEESMSYVIKALGKSDLEASNTIRLSFGKYNTLEEAKEFVSSFIEILEAVRN